MRRIQTPIDERTLRSLKAGDKVLLSGLVFTARDAAHKKMIEALDSGEDLPFDVNGQTLYYVGPSPTKPGGVIGSAGPTTSYRMDSFTPELLRQGLHAMIGKGKRSPEVIASIKEHRAVYFAAVGGAAALISDGITEVDIIAYEELGPEAVRRLVVENFPVVVIIDSKGNDYYKIGRQAYLESERG
jgi:fumarate hydratase subunit beta